MAPLAEHHFCKQVPPPQVASKDADQHPQHAAASAAAEMRFRFKFAKNCARSEFGRARCVCRAVRRLVVEPKNDRPTSQANGIPAVASL